MDVTLSEILLLKEREVKSRLYSVLLVVKLNTKVIYTHVAINMENKLDVNLNWPRFQI